jgi:hypothetical protein
MKSQPPCVEVIEFSRATDMETTDIILDFLFSAEDLCFKDNLKSLSIRYCDLYGNNL